MSRGHPHPPLKYKAGGNTPCTELYRGCSAQGHLGEKKKEKKKAMLYFTALSISLRLQHELQLNCSPEAQGRCIPLKGKWRVKESAGAGMLNS